MTPLMSAEQYAERQAELVRRALRERPRVLRLTRGQVDRVAAVDARRRRAA